MTIEQALKQVVTPSVVSEFAMSVFPYDLIEEVASALEMDEDALLPLVAERLQLGWTTELQPPTAALLAATGIDAAVLRDALAIPQSSQTSSIGYALVISDPTLIDLTAFREHGVSIILSTGRRIAEKWQEYDLAIRPHGNSITSGQLFAVMRHLALDAGRCGAHEVFIGHPNEEGYEFFARGNLYSGRLHRGIYPMLLERFRNENRIVEPVENNELRNISFALTRSFERPVVCLSWELSSEAQTRVAELPEPAPQGKSSELPTEIPSPSPSVPKDGPTPAPITPNWTVLLIDDDSRFLLILSKILEAKGLTVESRTEAHQALNSIRDQLICPDLVISDVHMPGMDGVTFLRELRAAHPGIPVIMLTSDEERLLEAELALLGADAFVRKQEDPKILLAWCINLLTRRSRFRENVPLPSQASTSDTTISEFIQ